MGAVVVVLVSFVAMEPVAYLTHRFVMHGRRRGARWHVSHHRPRRARFEDNDRYPFVLATLTIVAIAAGTSSASLRVLAWAGVGVTLYGAVYLFVHDIYIHRRIARFTWRCRPLDAVREAHRIHHLWGGEPYGFLVPVVPAALRAKARGIDRDPLATEGRRTVAAAAAVGGPGQRPGGVQGALRPSPSGGPVHRSRHRFRGRSSRRPGACPTRRRP